MDVTALAAATELLPDATVVRDRDGVVLGCNAAFLRLVGMPRHAVTEKKFQDVLPGDLIRTFARADGTEALIVSFRATFPGRAGAEPVGCGVRQRRITDQGALCGWVTTIRRASLNHDRTREIAAALVNRSFGTLRVALRTTMRRLARECRAEGAVILRQDAERGRYRQFCRWMAPDRDGEDDNSISLTLEDRVASAVARLETVRNIPLPELKSDRCTVYPVNAQQDLLGILVVVEPRVGEEALPRLVATLVAGVLVRREIEKLLNEYTVDLERRVHERTADLNVAYETLKQTQVQLVQAGKMASVGRLAAGIAHEINNPVGYIKSNLNSLADYIETLMQAVAREGCDTEELQGMQREIREMIDESREGVRRVEGIVGNLLSFARIDEGAAGRADINELIETSLKVINNELKYHVTVHREYGEIPEIGCQPDRLNQVFVNLLLNAAQALPEVGDIWITTGVDEDHVMIRIADNGRGIPEEQQSRIFEPFFTTKDVGQGTGLGLSIVWDIIRAHEGTINLESTRGEGTAFIISLPLSGPEIDVDAVLRGQ